MTHGKKLTPAEKKQRRDERFRYLTGFARVAIFYFLGLSLFFIAGFIIITMRVSVKQDVTVPAVVGKLFLEEYNRLSDLGIKVNLERYYSTEYPLGFIMAQSLPAGKVVKEGAKLTLLVNQSESVVAVPLLVGISEDLVDGIIGNIPVGGRTFKLQRGTVTRVTSEKPKGEVLEQHPPAGTMVTPNAPVSILVSAGPPPKGQAAKVPVMNSVPVRIAARAAYELKLPLVLNEVAMTDLPEEDGLVTVTAIPDELLAKITRYRFPKKRNPALAENELPFRFIWLAPEKVAADKIVTLVSDAAFPGGASEEQSFWYLKITNQPVPLFLRTQEEIKVYDGFFATAKPAQAVAVPEGATSLLAEEQVAVNEVKPLKILKLRSGDV